MPALNFQLQFADQVASGKKRQTIRAHRKDGRNPRAGDRLFLYTGMRTKSCRKLGEATCSSVRPVCVYEDVLYVQGEPMRGHTADCRAREDGFADYADMTAWFAQVHGLPFSGWLIRWSLAGDSNNG